MAHVPPLVDCVAKLRRCIVMCSCNRRSICARLPAFSEQAPKCSLLILTVNTAVAAKIIPLHVRLELASNSSQVSDLLQVQVENLAAEEETTFKREKKVVSILSKSLFTRYGLPFAKPMCLAGSSLRIHKTVSVTRPVSEPAVGSPVYRLILAVARANLFAET